MSKPVNLGLLVTIVLPLFAIGASTSIAVVAFTRGDPTLPDEYHWEGMNLDRDFAAARRAADLDVRAVLQVQTGICRVRLEITGARPPALGLKLVHGAFPGLDRQVRLDLAGEDYEGPCGEIPAGQWHLELSDVTGSWSVRQDTSGALDGITIAARPKPQLPDR
jgi:hypothetical protein